MLTFVRKCLHFHQPPCKGFRHEPEASPSHHGRGRCIGRAVRGQRVGPNPGRRHRPPPRHLPHRPPNPTAPSPATSGSSANTCSAASRRRTKSLRSRAASTWAHKSGFYVGTWASNVSWISRRQSRRVGQPRMGLLRRLQVGAAGRLRARPGRPLLLLPGQLSERLHEAEHDRTLRRADLEDAAGEVQLQRRQQDVRLSRFARFLLLRGQPQLGRHRQGQRHHRQGHAHRSRRLPDVQEQRQLQLHATGRSARRPKSGA